jgi:hypothetical protein
MAEDIVDPAFQPGTKEYHRRKSREWYERTKAGRPDILKDRHDYVAARRVASKSKFVQEFGGKCAHCGGVFPDCVFEFHHKDGSDKEYGPSHLFHLKEQTIRTELAKCIMLCANCHRMEHERLKYPHHSKRAFHGKLDEVVAAWRETLKQRPSSTKGVPKPAHSEKMKEYWRRRKEAEMQAGRM